MGALFWMVPCLFWAHRSFAARFIPNRTIPGTQEHAAGSDSADHGERSSYEVILPVCNIQRSSKKKIFLKKPHRLKTKLVVSGQLETESL